MRTQDTMRSAKFQACHNLLILQNYRSFSFLYDRYPETFVCSYQNKLLIRLDLLFFLIEGNYNCLANCTTYRVFQIVIVYFIDFLQHCDISFHGIMCSSRRENTVNKPMDLILPLFNWLNKWENDQVTLVAL